MNLQESNVISSKVYQYFLENYTFDSLVFRMQELLLAKVDLT